jgi:hypothetical protein
LQKQYDTIDNAVTGFNFTFEEFKQASAAVADRQFNLEIDGKSTPCLVPFADMCTKSLPPSDAFISMVGVMHDKCNVEALYDSYLQGLVLRATKDIPQNMEVCITNKGCSPPDWFINHA